MHNSQLDEIDKKILDYLVENTRMPFTEIAQKMGVSAGTIHVRVKKMEDVGIICGSSLVIMRTESMISIEEYFSDKNRLIKAVEI